MPHLSTPSCRSLLIAGIIGHIYIGTIGMEGAFDAMGSGEVDLNWAREHHSLWLEEELRKGKGKAPAVGREFRRSRRYSKSGPINLLSS